ncbi:MAG: peptide deformylase [Oscillospiraceae bacterium]|nr:peptide deformylase [Oscillospiraceae bacterium]
MALRTIIKDGDGTLERRSRDVTNFDRRLHALLDDMLETMRSVDGVGLAAVQVGVLRRAVVIEVAEGEVIELINPEITESEDVQNGVEGCLSFPGIYGMVERPMRVKVRALDRHGKEIAVEGCGLLARAMCHEIDHLNGAVFTSLVTEYVDAEQAREDREKQGYYKE